MSEGLLRLLGTGTAFNTDGRGSQALLVEPGDQSPFLVDAGPTLMQAAEREGIDHRRIDRLFFTHLHGDHVMGWPFLLLHFVIRDTRATPFHIIGPRGVRDSCEELAKRCWGSVVSRRDFELTYRELDVVAAEALDGEQGLRFDVVPMDHHPSSIAYRFDLGGVRLGITGDTRWFSGLEAFAARCDLLVLECTAVDPIPAHVSLSEIRRGRDRLPPRVVLVHLTDAVATELDTDPIPGVVAGYDGMELVI